MFLVWLAVITSAGINSGSWHYTLYTNTLPVYTLYTNTIPVYTLYTIAIPVYTLYTDTIEDIEMDIKNLRVGIRFTKQISRKTTRSPYQGMRGGFQKGSTKRMTQSCFPKMNMRICGQNGEKQRVNPLSQCTKKKVKSRGQSTRRQMA